MRAGNKQVVFQGIDGPKRQRPAEFVVSPAKRELGLAPS